MIKHLRLDIALGIGLLLGLLLPLTISAYNTIVNEQSQRAREIELITESTAKSLALPLWNMSHDWGKSVVESVLLDPLILDVSLINLESGEVFVGDRQHDSFGRKRQEIEREVVYEKERIGLLKIGFDQEMIDEALASQYRHFALLLLLQLALGLAVLMPLIYYRVLQPVRMLMGYAARLKDRELATPFALNRQDELGRLAQSFEEARMAIATMVETIEENNHSLYDTNKKLENTVKELKNTQARLVESEKMAALGTLVSGVAHEINTPLGIAITAISSLENKTEQLKEKSQEGTLKKKDFSGFLEYVEEVFHSSLTQLERAAQLVQGFKYVSVDQFEDALRSFDLCALMREFSITLQSKLEKSNITLLVECESLTLESYPEVFLHLVSHMVDNSLKHGFTSQASGTIHLQIVKEAEGVKIRYQDNGVGMDEKTLKKVFEPFFTTNRQAGCVGLGMHIIYNLVTQKLGGEIRCESEPKKGVVFEIVIPV